MTPVLALLASPFLGPAVWQPVADALVAAGRDVVVPPASVPRTPHDVLEAFLAVLPAQRDLVLVPHSNAGLYVPALAMRRRVTGFVFVDARLPTAPGPLAMVPPALLDELRPTADADGLLPRWTDWWDEADVAGLFPDAAVRRRVEREQHRIPLTYVEGSVEVPAGWDRRPGAYLAFGDTYAEERERAAGLGWPVATVAGAHLHMLVAPGAVAERILALVAGFESFGRS